MLESWIPAIVTKLTTELPEQLEDLEAGYRKLLDETTILQKLWYRISSS